MNAWLSLPPAVQIGLVALAGLAAGSAVNWAIYSLAWFPRPISPWSRPHSEAPSRPWICRLPVVGWLWLAREEKLHGRWFWVRPLLLELALAVGLAGLYAFEMRGGLWPRLPGLVGPAASIVVWQFISHALLILLMTAATFIDFDEKTIPDSITIPGTLLGLALAALVPDSLLPDVAAVPGGMGTLVAAPLQVAAPYPFPAWLHTGRGLALGCLIFVLWCAAMIQATCTLRRGWSKGVRYYFVSISRGNSWRFLAALAALGCGLIAWVWSRGGQSWAMLLTALVGLAFSGGLIWAVRIVGWIALRREAMGFGDVTLMAMIGAFLGWQTSLLVFFFSPLSAVIVALAQWAVTRRHDLAFGPYLCLSALYLIVAWRRVWFGWADEIFTLGWLLVGLVGACLLLMLGLLMSFRLVREALSGTDSGSSH
ncbi:MAG: A24 family peptidase [Pirellulaceae bacterium]|nr:A24 family peptidase [Pirellulaceae bacterium]